MYWMWYTVGTDVVMMMTIRANNPVLMNRRIKRIAEPDFGYEHTQLYNSLTECVRICSEVLTPAFVEAGKGLHKWLEEHPEYGRDWG